MPERAQRSKGAGQTEAAARFAGSELALEEQQDLLEFRHDRSATRLGITGSVWNFLELHDFPEAGLRPIIETVGT
ncbi:hypothetical protein [Rhizobium leguminosarum]|uniref:Uncharacterized protein n=1 Tax=Rhizobium leguminosarum TaxID=384 RepID=A0A1B1CBS2_RHILE|nr:hypothetical protein [Rhizobium leguminosarum]ANP87191.1 hypothetical protein BA011_16650 [Rhizobium leguminosarum]